MDHFEMRKNIIPSFLPSQGLILRKGFIYIPLCSYHHYRMSLTMKSNKTNFLKFQIRSFHLVTGVEMSNLSVFFYYLEHRNEDQKFENKQKTTQQTTMLNTTPKQHTSGYL